MGGFKTAAARRQTVLDVNVDLAEAPSASVMSRVLKGLLKSLIFQSGVIPLHYEFLERDAKAAAEELLNPASGGSAEADVEQMEESGEVDARRALRQRRAKLKLQRRRARYLKLAVEFEASFRSLAQQLDDLIKTHSRSIRSVAFLLGATPFSPKGVFQIFLPRLSPFGDGPDSAKRARQIAVQVFRRLVAEEMLLPASGGEGRRRGGAGLGPTGPTNVFVAVRMSKHEEPPPHLSARPELGQWQRGKNVVHFRFEASSERGEMPADMTLTCPRGPLPASPPARGPTAARRAIWPAAAEGEEEDPGPISASDLREDALSPSPEPMDICDSILSDDGLSASPEGPRCSSLMTETPCVRPAVPPGVSYLRRNSWQPEPMAGAGEKINQSPENSMEENPGEHGQDLLWFLFTEKLRGFKNPQI